MRPLRTRDAVERLRGFRARFAKSTAGKVAVVRKIDVPWEAGNGI
jgi:hypothetical protein